MKFLAGENGRKNENEQFYMSALSQLHYKNIAQHWAKNITLKTTLLIHQRQPVQ